MELELNMRPQLELELKRRPHNNFTALNVCDCKSTTTTADQKVSNQV